MLAVPLSPGVSILGTTADFPSVRDMEVANGRYFNDQDVDRESKIAIVGATLAEELFGDEDPIGQDITIGTVRFSVIGVLKRKAWSAM